MRMSIIIPAKNEERYIGDCLTSVLASRTETVDDVVVVVDERSSDATEQIARTFPVTVMRVSTPGTNSARQRGAERTQSEILAFIDADCRIDRQWIDAIEKAFSRSPTLACISGPYDYYDLHWMKKWIYEAYIHTLSKLLTLLFGEKVYGGNFAVRRSAWEASGGFDVGYTFFGDDTSVATRLARAGTVRFQTSLRVRSSGRRFNREGFFHLGTVYIATFIRDRLRNRKRS